jgi:hypothetical protein
MFYLTTPRHISTLLKAQDFCSQRVFGFSRCRFTSYVIELPISHTGRYSGLWPLLRLSFQCCLRVHFACRLHLTRISPSREVMLVAFVNNISAADQEVVHRTDALGVLIFVGHGV